MFFAVVFFFFLGGGGEWGCYICLTSNIFLGMPDNFGGGPSRSSKKKLTHKRLVSFLLEIGNQWRPRSDNLASICHNVAVALLLPVKSSLTMFNRVNA